MAQQATEPLDQESVDRVIEAALQEDLGISGDLTSCLSFHQSTQGRADIIARQAGIVAGLDLAKLVFQRLDTSIAFRTILQDGQDVGPDSAVAQVEGPLTAILAGERTALNFLQRLSGVATLTAAFVRRIQGTKACILDTRKTTPGLRQLEKYAVRMGGGRNHRMGLYDMVLIKENHISAAGGITEAVTNVREALRAKGETLAIEVEITNLAQLREALSLGVDRVMLDNMAVAEVREAVQLAAGRVETEVSGGVTLETVRELAETGVDFISVGALTHSAPALDLSLIVTETWNESK